MAETPTLFFCRNCDKEVPFTVEMIYVGPHSGKIKCSICGQFLGWKKKDKNKDKREQSKYKPHDLGFNFCQMCLRERSHLGLLETLEVHHIWPVEDGGQDIPKNLWVLCTHCHRLIHHTRTYLNEHFKFFWERYDAERPNA